MSTYAASIQEQFSLAPTVSSIKQCISEGQSSVVVVFSSGSGGGLPVWCRTLLTPTTGLTYTFFIHKGVSLSLGQLSDVSTNDLPLVKEKERKRIYIAPLYILCISQSAQAWITQFYLQIHHACLSFVCVHQMAPPLTEVRDI